MILRFTGVLLNRNVRKIVGRHNGFLWTFFFFKDLRENFFFLSRNFFPPYFDGKNRLTWVFFGYSLFLIFEGKFLFPLQKIFFPPYFDGKNPLT